jgi:hypothetical protein
MHRQKGEKTPVLSILPYEDFKGKAELEGQIVNEAKDILNKKYSSAT